MDSAQPRPRNTPLSILQCSTAATSLGKWAFLLALAVYAFHEGGAYAVGLVALVQAVPATFAAPFLGIAADKYSRQRVLLVTNLMRSALVALVAFAVLEGGSVAVVFVLAAVYAVVSTANQPARAALIPVLSRTPREVASATTLMGVVDNASYLVGAGIGGLVLAATSIEFVMALCSACYLAASMMILFIPRDERTIWHELEPPFEALTAGIRAALDDSHLRLAVGVLTTLAIFEGLYSVLVIILAIDLLDIGTAGIGYLNIAEGLGGIIGGSVAYMLFGQQRLAFALEIGCMTIGLPMILVGLVPETGIAVVAWACIGFGYLVVKVTGLTLVQRLSGDRVLGRVLAVVETSFVGAVGIGALLAPILISLVQIEGALIITGALLPVMGVLRFSAVRRLEIGAPVPAEEFALLRHCDVFAPLPIATTEGLAHRLIPVEVAAGVDIVTEGDLGDRFYLIADGEVEVSQNGEPIRRQTAGESFGEIALLHSVTRTATVRAVQPTRLLALEREPFLFSITGHADSHRAALHVADRFMAPSET